MSVVLSRAASPVRSSIKREELRNLSRQLKRQMLFESLEDRNLLATLYWDPNGPTAGVGGAGTWDTTSAFWTTDPTGLAGHVAWDNAANDTAVFGQTPGTVTINPSVATINVGGIDFDISGFTIATAASKSLTFAPASSVDVEAGASATISGVISGTNGFTKINDGELILSGTNTYTGVTTVSAGTLAAASNGALGTTAGNTVVNTGATLDVRATTAEPLNVRGTGVGGIGALISTTTGTVSGTVTQGAASSIGGPGNLTLSGVVSGNFTLTKVGAGNLTLSGTNTYTAATNITAGTLIATNAQSLGTTAGGVTIASGATLDVRNNISTEAVNVNGSGVGGNGALITTTGTGTVGGTVTLAGATTIGGASTLNINGNIVGAFPLTKVGAGTTVLNGTNTYSGPTTVTAGTLRFVRPVSLYNNTPASWTDTNIIVNSGATLAFNVGGTGFTEANIQTLSGLGSATGGFLSGSFLGLDASNAPGGVFTYPNAITNTNGGANVLGVASLGTGTVRLSGANTYTGPTQVRSGILQFANTAALYGGSSANWTPTNLVVSSGATLAFNVGGAGEFSTSDLDILKGLGTATGGFLSGSSLGIDTTNAVGDFEYASSITNTNANANVLGVTKLGTGTLALSGVNTYTGFTTILGGTLEKASATGIPTGTALVFGNRYGAVGTLDLSNFSQTAASIAAVSNTATANTILVGDGQTLTVSGANGITVGIDLGGSSSTTTNLTITGPGALVVNNTAANVTVGLAQANQASNNTATLDLTGLSSVTLGSVAAPINEVRVGYGQTNDGTLLLSNTSNVVTANSIFVGNSLTANAHGSPSLILGTGTNILNANLIGIGLGKSADSSLSFASQLPGSPGTVVIAGKTGGASTANITVGSNTVVDTGALTSGTLDLRGHEVTVAAGTVTVGETNRTGTTTASLATGTLSFDQGTFTATTVNVGVKGAQSPGPGTGTLNIGGGDFTAGTINLATYSAASGVATTAATGTLNLTGGTLTVGTLRGAAKTAAGLGSATSNINVSGGELIVNTLFRLASQATAGTAVGNLNVTGTGVVTSNVDIVDGGGAVNTAVTLDGGTLDLTNHNIGGTTPIDTLTFASGTLQNVAQINDGAGLTKTTTGQLILAGTNAYTGPTVVDAGKLVVNGTTVAGSPVTVNTGGSLGGTGIISGTVTTAGTGTIDAGDAGAESGTLRIENTVVLASTSTFAVQLGGTTPGDGPGFYDQVTTAGSVDLGGATLDLSLDSFIPAVNDEFIIINKTSAGPVTGTFSYQSDPLIEGEQFVVAGNTYEISYVGGDGNDVVITTVTVAPNAAPTAIALTPTTITENAGPNATVGTFTTTDPTSGDTFTYTLVGGPGSTDNAAFNISGDTLRATNSLDFETQQTYSVRVRSTDAGGLFFEEVFTINVSDVNEIGVTVTPTSGLTTTEAGGTATFTIVLTSQPTGDVTIPLSSSDTTEGTVSPASVTFTSVNWNVAQTVTVTGVDDILTDGPIAYTIVTGPATSSDVAYSGFNAADVAVSNSDNEAAGITVTPTTGLTTTEAGAAATFTIVLNTQPTADVTIPLSSSDTTEGTVAPTSVTFTTLNWNVPQTVTVTGVDDALVDGTVAYTIVTGPATSTDVAYTGFNAADVAVSNTDDEVAVPAGVTVTPTSGLSTTEAGGTATFTIVLNTQPTSDVTIPLSSSDTTEGTVSPASVTFTTANWNVPQTVTITGVDDAIVDGAIAYTIVTGPATSSDLAYSGFNAEDVAVSNSDNDSAGVTVTPTSGLSTTEAGGTANFTIVLNTQPSADVTIPLSSSDATEGTVAPTSVTFTTANWNVPQTITVTGVDDALADGSIAYTVVTAPATSTDAAYSGFNAADVSLLNSDNDTAGVTVTPTVGLTTTEAGGTATFTIVLNTQPTANVTIPLTSSDITEGTVAPASVTFTTANWNVPQTVTVTGVDDAILDGTVAYSVITGPATSTDPAYSGFNVADVGVSNTDNEVAVPGSFTVSPTTGLTTTESGGVAVFTIVLNSQPTADVIIPLSSSDTTEGTVSPTSITFTSANWNVPQFVTVTGVDDAIADGTIAYTIITGAATSTDVNYSGADPADVSLNNVDNEVAVPAGVTVAPTSGLITTEAGGTATFTVVLNSAPTADVTIPLSSSDLTEGTVSPSSITFTTANWNVPQTVTVTGVDDAIVDGIVAYTIVTGAATSTDPAYSGFNANDVGVSNTDNDVAGPGSFTVTPSSGLTTTEAGGIAVFTIVLNTQPTADVIVPLSSSDTTEGTVSPTSLTFTSANWNVPQFVTVTGADDAIADGTIAYTIITGAATSTDANYSGVNPADVSLDNVDNEVAAPAGVTVAPTSGLITTEAGGAATFTIVLNSAPTADVTIPLSSSDATEGSVSPSSVTFTPANWNVPQTVTVTGLDDAIVDGTIAYTIITGAATSTDPAYSGFNANDVGVSNTDNDAGPGSFTVSPTSGLTTTESGGVAVFTIVLNTQPTGDVVVPLTSSDTTEGTVSPASITFTSANWNVPQLVTVTGVDDALVDGTIAYTIITGAATSSDVNYSGVNPADVSLNNADNEIAASAGVTVTPTSGLITTEAGGTATFTIVLNSQPTGSVTIPLSSSDTTEGTVSQSSITFTTANWNVPQTVTVTGVDDAIVDGTVSYTIITGPATSTDTTYSGFNASDVGVANTDNDVAGPGSFTVSPTSGLTTTESGGVAAFTIVLNTQPTANVTVALTSSDTTEGTVSPSSITFTPANWNVPQLITATGVDDAIVDGTIAYTIITGAATSTDTNYSGVNPADVSLSNSDNEVAVPGGITVTPTAGLTTTEAGGTATFTIVLNSQPTASVTIPLTSGDLTEGTVSPASVTFTTANWNVPQTVTVTGVDDAIIDGNISYAILTGAATSTDASYNGVNAADVSVTNTDNDTTGNAAPTISDIGNQTTNEDTPTSSIPFTVNDAETAAAGLTVSATSSNTTLFPAGSIIFGGSGTNRTISLNPAANQSGTATITVTVADGSGGQASDTFTVTVSPVNDAPTLNPISNPTPVPQNSGPQTINLTGISAGGGETQNLTVTATSSNPALIPNPTVTYTSPNSTGTLTYTPVPNQSGTATITVTVTDDGGTANGGVNTTTQTFTVSVTGATIPLPLPTTPGTAQVVDDPENPGRGVLVINGTSNLDLITVLRSGSNQTLVSVPLSGIYRTYNNSTFDRIVINGYAGSDRIILDPFLEKPATIYGDAGDDIILGGAGNDTIYGGSGTDVIYGRSGNDFIFGEGNRDYLYGDDGDDVIVGGADDDVIWGGNGRDVLNGGGGLDYIYGFGGDDLIIAGNLSQSNSIEGLESIQSKWTSNQSFDARISSLAAEVNQTTVTNDSRADWIYAMDGRDWIVDYALLDMVWDFNSSSDRRN